MELNAEDIVAYIEQLEKDSKALTKEILRICWYMRGGITYNDAILLTKTEREIIGDIIKDNIELTKETKMPLL